MPPAPPGVSPDSPVDPPLPPRDKPHGVPWENSPFRRRKGPSVLRKAGKRLSRMRAEPDSVFEP